MVDFRLSDEQRMLRDSLRRIPERCDGDDLWQELADAGIFAALLPEAYGGLDGSGATTALVMEELGRAGVALPVTDSIILGGRTLGAVGDMDHIIEPLTKGMIHIAFAHLEQGDHFSITPSLRAVDDRITGRKCLVRGAPAADCFLVNCANGLFMVARNVAGLTLRPVPLLDGTEAADLIFDQVPATCLTENIATGSAFSYAILAVCAEALGMMEAVKEMTVAYLKTRQQFGRPLAQFQALAHRLADMAVEIEQARSAVINLAGHVDADELTRSRHSFACKALVGRVARYVAAEAVQLHGGIGMTAEYDLARYVRRLLAADIVFGNADFHTSMFMRISAHD